MNSKQIEDLKEASESIRDCCHHLVDATKELNKVIQSMLSMVMEEK